MSKKRDVVVEFGDFQTPPYLAHRICQLLEELEFQPRSMIEPTCGMGNLFLAALEQFPSLIEVVGVDINPDYIAHLEGQLASLSQTMRQERFVEANVSVDDFFAVNWAEILVQLPEPILLIGNPPWVTNSELSILNSKNLPEKTNFKNLSGLSAKTGKSNFDISEWMLIHLLELADQRQLTMAMLCKTSVARKVLTYAWKRDLNLKSASIYRIDAKQAFGASVDACLLLCEISNSLHGRTCDFYDMLSQDAYETTFGFSANRLIANVAYYERWQHLQGEEHYKWRSGIKHDAAKVMELRFIDGRYINKLGAHFDLEQIYLYPMLKSSDVAKSHPIPTRWMLVTQRSVGEDTAIIEQDAPHTWAYLHQYSDILERRKSSIYRNRPPFSIFGVGEYSFAPWKVAVSGLYKKLHFVAVGPYASKPVVLDDTCYFIPCQCQEEALFLAGLLNSEVAQQFFEAFIFWDAKRPITIEILRKLDLIALAQELGEKEKIVSFIQSNRLTEVQPEQLSIWD